MNTTYKIYDLTTGSNGKVMVWRNGIHEDYMELSLSPDLTMKCVRIGDIIYRYIPFDDFRDERYQKFLDKCREEAAE